MDSSANFVPVRHLFVEVDENGFSSIMNIDVNRFAMDRHGLILRQNAVTTSTMPINLFLTAFHAIFN